MRSFIALEISPFIRNELEKLYDPFRSKYPEIKWVPPENLHLTIKFLGEINFSQVTELKEKLNYICRQHKSFSIIFQGTGAFPNFRFPKVFWVGTKKSSKLVKLAQDISLIGDFRENDLRPHITLARIREYSPGVEIVKNYLKSNLDKYFGELNVEGLSLIKSILKPTGPVYERIHFSKLN